jgi:hypothetical protein
VQHSQHEILRNSVYDEPSSCLIKAKLQRGPDFLRLANALSALYPKTSEEKRLLDVMLLAMPR